MFKDRALELAIRASETTVRRIREDRERASAQLGPILGYVESHLLDHELQIGTLKRSCGIRDESISRRFAAELGHTPWAYVTDCRMEIAARMLLNSDLKPWRIGTSVGYASGGSFGRAFKRWSGQTPVEYRKAPARRIAGAQLERELVTGAELGAALAGELDRDRAELLIHRLGTLRDQICAIYPGVRVAPPPVARPVVGAELVEKTLADNLWARIEDLPAEELRQAVRHQVAFCTPALFKLLEKKSRECKDPERAVEIAELMLDSLENLAPQLGRLLPNFKADAWNTIATARLGRGDLDGAAQAARLVEDALEVAIADDHFDPVVVIKAVLGRVPILIRQGRGHQAAPLVSLALEVYDLTLMHLQKAQG